MAAKACRVSVRDLKGVDHAVEVTADSLFEAVARGLRLLQEGDWVPEIIGGLATVKVTVTQPEIEHTVRMKDFERWLGAVGGSPADVVQRDRARSILGR